MGRKRGGRRQSFKDMPVQDIRDLPGETTLPCPEDGCDGMLILKESRYGPFYGCNQWRRTRCPGAHGAHPDGSPLGTPADKETKRWRMQAHEVFDALWEQGTITRSEAYAWLAREFGHEAHIADMDIEQCQRVIELVDEVFY